MSERNVCKEHSKVEAFLENNIELLEKQGKCLSNLLERITRQEELLKQCSESIRQLEGRFYNTITKLTQDVDIHLDEFEERIDSIEKKLDKLDGVITSLKIGLTLIMSSGIVGIIWSLIKSKP